MIRYQLNANITPCTVLYYQCFQRIPNKGPEHGKCGVYDPCRTAIWNKTDNEDVTQQFRVFYLPADYRKTYLTHWLQKIEDY
jgi:hypothetical protein